MKMLFNLSFPSALKLKTTKTLVKKNPIVKYPQFTAVNDDYITQCKLVV